MRILSLLGILVPMAATVFADSGMTLILGRPTATSVTLSARPESPSEIFVEFGTEPGAYDRQTPPAVLEAGSPREFQLDDLQPDSRYFYRLSSRPAGSDLAFTPGEEHSFHTQRARSSSFVFCLQGDSHPERAGTMFNADLYARTLRGAAADQPDFYVLLGDDFSVDTLKSADAASVAERYTLQLPWLSLLAHTSPLFLVNGNHEQSARYLLDGTPDNVAVWARNARNRYYPQPAPDGFYSGDEEEVPHIGLPRDYFAWEWGDALFVVLDPYWGSPVAVDNVFGAKSHDPGQNGKTADKWTITHGDAQYQWLKKTLEESTARWKFVFAHHVLGTGRGGAEIARQFEWGGFNEKGEFQFPAKRPNWALPIHQLMAANGVTVFFHAHDHLFAREQVDGVVYQETPNPADNTYTAFNADAYPNADVFPNSGYLRVSVGPDEVKVDYIRQYLPVDENAPERVSGAVQFSYTIPGPPPAASASRKGPAPTTPR